MYIWDKLHVHLGLTTFLFFLRDPKIIYLSQTHTLKNPQHLHLGPTACKFRTNIYI